MRYTERGRVTPEHLARLEADAGRYPKPWTMGVGSYVMKAIIAELRELRAMRADWGDLGRWEDEGGPVEVEAVVIEQPEPRVNTKEENIAFRKAWDARVDAGQARER